MKWKRREKGYMLRLEQGEPIIQTLTNFCIDQCVISGEFWGIGQVTDSELGIYDLSTQKYHFHKLSRVLEVASLTGDISYLDEKPFIHVHTVLSDGDLRTYGGHLKEGIVGGTLEIYLVNYESEIVRKKDPHTGLSLWDL